MMVRACSKSLSAPSMCCKSPALVGRCSLYLSSGIPIGPRGRNKRSAAVGQTHEQLQHAASSNAADDGQAMAFEGMTLPRDDNGVRDITVMGSLCAPSSTR